MSRLSPDPPTDTSRHPSPERPIASCLDNAVYIELSGRVLCEPLTVLTDALLALQLLWFAGRSRGRARLWFALMALTFALGGGRHLFHHELPELLPWMSRVQNIASSVALGLVASLLALGRGARGQARAELVYGLAAAGFVLGHLLLDSFLLTVIHQALALLGAAGLLLVQGRDRAYRPYLIHVGLGILCALIFLLRLSPHPWFDHNALAHVIMLGAFWAFWEQLGDLGWRR